MRVPPPDEALAKERARALRRASTPAEILLWSVLRQRPLGMAKFRRLMPFGPFILDFAAPSAKLAVEVDGETHFRDDGPQQDADRTAFLAHHAWRMLRLLNADVLGNLDGVVATIAAAAPSPNPHPGPLPKGEGAGKSPLPEGEGEVA